MATRPGNQRRPWRPLLALALLALAACKALPQRQPPPAVAHDFGPAAAAAAPVRLPVPVALAGVSAASWYDSPALYYRLLYEDAARLQPYAQSRWIAPPAELLALRLRQALSASADGIATSPRPWLLQVELEDFSQVFDAPGASVGLVRATARLLPPGRPGPLAQHTFTARRPAPTPDAGGGVAALRAAADQLVADIVAWSAQTLAALPSSALSRP